jgi:CRP-like cAMP-binding protein
MPESHPLMNAKPRPSKQQLLRVLRDLSRRLVDNQDDLPMRMKVAEVLRQLGRTTEAVALYQSVLRGHAKAGQLAEAIAISKLILELDGGQQHAQQGLLADLYARNAELQIRPAPTASGSSKLNRGDRLTRPYAATPRPLTPSADDTHNGEDRPSEIIDTASFLGDPLDPVDALRPTQPYEAQQKIALEIASKAQECPDEPLPSGVFKQGEADLQAALDNLHGFDSFVEDELSITAVPPYPLLSHLDRPSFLGLIDSLERKSFAAGQWVIREGEPGDTLYLVCAGRLEVLKETPNGPPNQLAVLKPGSFLGEFGLLADRKRHASVRCLQAAEVLLLEKSRLDTLLVTHPSVEDLLWRFYRRRLLKMVIQSSPLFAAVDPPLRKGIADRFKQVRVEKGQWVVQEDTPQDTLYVVLLGSLTVCQKHSVTGNQTMLRHLIEGDYFGEMSLLLGKHAEASVQADQICELLALPHADFYELCSEHPALWDEIEDECRQREVENISIHGELQRSKAGIL